MPESPRLLIANQWIDTAARLRVLDPATEQEVAAVPLGDESTLESAIEAAEEAFSRTRQQPPHERATLLEAVARGIDERKEQFSRLIVSESGKPVTFAEAEVQRAMLTFRTAAEEARREQGELLSLEASAPGSAHFGFTRRFPLGVIAAITPFNFPLNLVAHKVAPCLATGNTMVVKPALKTPLTALLLGEVLVEAGMPSGQVNIVTCPNEGVGKLVRDSRVQKVTFTGSTAVGWMLKEQCGKKRITLELGGNAAVVAHDDADLDLAIPAIARGAFGAAGQSCISVQRIFVHQAIYAAFTQRFLEYTRATMKTGDPKDRDVVIGPMISRAALDQAQARIAAAVTGGARLLLGGTACGNCLEATVLEGVPPDCELNAEEAFAPVCVLQPYASFEEALDLVNDSRFGLQAGIYTRDMDRAFCAFETLDVGAVLINEVPTWRVENMPYGGVKDSGFGREGVRYAMEEMTELKSLIFKRA